jgi:hypothetical protein
MLSLMLLCRQINQETMAMFLKHNHIVLYQMYIPQLPRAMRLDDHWFTEAPVPIRTLSLKGYDNLETPKIIASCPDLRYLCINRAAYSTSLEVATEEGKDAWILQYKTNLAKLLSRRNCRIRFEGNGTFYDIFELVGCGEAMDTDEVVELIEQLGERCRQVSYLVHHTAKLEGDEELVGMWVVKIGFKVGGIVTAVLVRGVGEDDV